MSKIVVVIVVVLVVVVLFPVAAHLLGGDAEQAEGGNAQPEAPATAAKPSVPAPAPVPATPEVAPSVPSGTPVVVSTNPPNGATDVSPSISTIQVTFSVPMGGGFSWCGGGPTFPGAQGGQPSWSADRKTCTLPVSLQSNTYYEMGLNCPSAKNFKSASGVPLSPMMYSFSTGSN